MKKYLSLILLTVMCSAGAVAQQAEPQAKNGQDNSVLGQYRREKATTPYKVGRKTSKGRRVATRKGNNELKKESFSSALNNYRTALKADSNYAKAQYNRALAHSRLGQNDTALAYYDKVCQNSSATREQRTMAHYNAGNIHLRKALAARDTGGYDAQSLQQAIKEYQSALRLDSKNSDAKHNLSLAKQLLRPENPNGGGQGQNNQDQNQSQDQNQQNKDQQNQQNKDQQDQQNKDQQNQQNQQNQNQQDKQNPQDKKQQEQRRREAEQMLNAMKNNEQQTMKSVRMKEASKERRQGSPTKIEKDW